MTSHIRREIAELLSIGGCKEYSSRTPSLRLRIASPGLGHEFTTCAPSSREPKQAATAVWAILMVVIVVTGTFWAANQLCGLMAQRVQQIHQQRYRPQIAYPEFWKQGRNW